MMVVAQEHRVDVTQHVFVDRRRRLFVKHVDGRLVVRAARVERGIRDESKSRDIENGRRSTDVRRRK